MSFQENLRLYRIKAGYTQAKDFAAAIGVNYSTYIAYENQGKEPKYDTLLKIAAALNVSTDTLLGFPGVNRYEELKQAANSAGCLVTEGKGKITVNINTESVLNTRSPERNMFVHFLGPKAILRFSQAVFFNKAEFCQCMETLLSDFDDLISPARNEYVPLGLLRYLMKEKGEYPPSLQEDTPPTKK